MISFDEKDGCYVWKKGTKHQFTRNFWTDEFECKCSRSTCVEQRIKTSLVRKLQEIRDVCGPVTITSAFRCAEHQAHLRNSGYETARNKSTHEMGWAADIRTKDLIALKNECRKQFKAIGFAKTFIHVDERSDKDRRWFYSSS